MNGTDRSAVSGFAASSFVTLLLLAGSARAQAQRPPRVTSAADAAEAEALFGEAKARMDAGDFGAACAKFAESERLDPGAGTLLNLADCYEKNGQLASAWVTFRDAAAMASRTSRTTWAEQAQARAELLEPRVPRLTIRIDPSAANRAAVTRNGLDAPPSTWGTAIPLDPGVQHIVVTEPGKIAWSTSVAVDAEHARVVIEVPALEDAQAVTPAPPPASPTAPRTPTARILSLGALGGGVAAAAVGAIFGATAIHKNDEAAARCPTSPSCTDPSAVSLTDDARHAATASTIAFIASGALLTTGAVLFFTSGSSSAREPAAHAGLFVDGRTLGASVGGRF